MSSTIKAQILDQAVGPHLETDEGIDFLTGQATTDDIRVSLQPTTARATSLALPHSIIVEPLNASYR